MTQLKPKTDVDWNGERDELWAVLVEFSRIMRQRPFQNREGLRGISAFGFWWFLRKLNPDVVFEVGVWRGFSTWLIEQAVPDARIYSFDPIFFFEGYLKRRKLQPVYRSPRATYLPSEFSCADIRELKAGARCPVVFFDDHQHKIHRLRQAVEFGFRYVIFDDCHRGVGTHRSFEDEPEDGEAMAYFLDHVESYEPFPALWPLHEDVAGLRLDFPGLDFPVTDAVKIVYSDRRWYSRPALVTLRDGACPGPGSTPDRLSTGDGGSAL